MQENRGTESLIELPHSVLMRLKFPFTSALHWCSNFIFFRLPRGPDQCGTYKEFLSRVVEYNSMSQRPLRQISLLISHKNNDRRNGEERGACVDPPPATSMAVHGSGRRMQRSADPLPASTTHPRWRSRGRLADCRHRREVLAPLLPPVCPCHVEMSEVEITPVTTHPPASAARHGRAGARYCDGDLLPGK
jgi:hypothetical protein